MENIQIIALLALGWCIVFCGFHFFRLIKLGKVNDLSQKSGDVTSAVIYSNTAAMLPAQKESAYMHLPTFIAGSIYHIGTFLALLLFVLLFFKKVWAWLLIYWWIPAFLSCFLLATSLCGLSLFLKRLFSKKLKPFSNLDDLFSNGIVTLFQLFSFALLVSAAIVAFDKFYLFSIFYLTNILIHGYYISAIVLLLYLPFGKLKHAIYYFSARYHLGFFYGWRNTWPPLKKSKI